jgi:hypothetical protein
MRTTCLYCEAGGVTTALVPVGVWRCCPIHSKDFIASVTALPDGYALVRKPVLLGLGVPSRNN